MDHHAENTFIARKRKKVIIMILLKKLFATFILLGLSTLLHAQGGSGQSKVGAFMRSDERAYVVIAVMLTILIGIFLYIIRLEKKISRLEREQAKS